MLENTLEIRILKKKAADLCLPRQNTFEEVTHWNIILKNYLKFSLETNLLKNKKKSVKSHR